MGELYKQWWGVIIIENFGPFVEGHSKTGELIESHECICQLLNTGNKLENNILEWFL